MTPVYTFAFVENGIVVDVQTVGPAEALIFRDIGVEVLSSLDLPRPGWTYDGEIFAPPFE